MTAPSPARAALERVLNSANHGLAAHGVRRSLGELDGMEDAKLLRRVIEAAREVKEARDALRVAFDSIQVRRQAKDDLANAVDTLAAALDGETPC